MKQTPAPEQPPRTSEMRLAPHAGLPCHGPLGFVSKQFIADSRNGACAWVSPARCLPSSQPFMPPKLLHAPCLSLPSPIRATLIVQRPMAVALSLTRAHCNTSPPPLPTGSLQCPASHMPSAPTKFVGARAFYDVLCDALHAMCKPNVTSRMLGCTSMFKLGRHASCFESLWKLAPQTCFNLRPKTYCGESVRKSILFATCSIHKCTHCVTSLM